MTVETITSADGNYEVHRGTVQEVLDELDHHNDYEIINVFYDDNKNEYVAVCLS